MNKKEKNKGRKVHKLSPLKGNPKIIKACIKSSVSIRLRSRGVSEIGFDLDSNYFKVINNIYNQEMSDIDNFVKFAEQITRDK